MHGTSVASAQSAEPRAGGGDEEETVRRDAALDVPTTGTPTGTASAPFYGFGMGLELAPAFGGDGMVMEGRLSLLAQFGTAHERPSGRFSGRYFSGGFEGTIGGQCASDGDDYCAHWARRGTIGPTARLSWGRGRGKGAATTRIFPTFSVYAKGTPFVVFRGSSTGVGTRVGFGFNAPGASREVLSEDDEGDGGSGQAGSLGLLLAIPAALFTHVELFVEADRVDGDSDLRVGLAFGFGL